MKQSEKKRQTSVKKGKAPVKKWQTSEKVKKCHKLA